MGHGFVRQHRFPFARQHLDGAPGVARQLRGEGMAVAGPPRGAGGKRPDEPRAPRPCATRHLDHRVAGARACGDVERRAVAQAGAQLRGGQRRVDGAGAPIRRDPQGEQQDRVAAHVDDRGDDRLPGAARGHHATDAEPAPVLASPPSSRHRASASSARSASARFFSAPRAARASGGKSP